jgi:O-antigen/teichoic acid export membrane protein
MAEALGRGDTALARAIFYKTLRIQSALAGVVTLGALAAVFAFVRSEYQWISVVQVLSIFPAMLVAVPSQANNAREDVRANVPSSLVSVALHTSIVVLSLLIGWGLLGCAFAFLVSRTVEVTMRLVSVTRWVNLAPETKLPQDVARRMFNFSGQSTVMMLLHVVVWDRSDIIILKMMSDDLRQITFYTLAFNLTERALTFPHTFANALSGTFMAQHGRDPAKVSLLASTAARYLFLLAAPLLLGMAALSGPITHVLYGQQYVPAIPVLLIAALFAIPKPLLIPAQRVLQVQEKQGALVVMNCVCAAINIGLDFYFIPKWGAIGAALANGSAQTLAVIGTWGLAIWYANVTFPVARVVVVTIASALAALAAYSVSVVLPPALALPAGTLTGAAVFLACVRIMRILSIEDVYRFDILQRFVPARLRPGYFRFLQLVTGVVPERV